MAGTRLYPPIVPSSVPAFKYNIGDTESTRFYFSISPYNSSDDIGAVQVSIKHQKSNLTIFKTCEIITVFYNIDNNKKGAYKYYIDLEDVMAKAGNDNFPDTNEFFKVQLRFVGKNAELNSLTNSQTMSTIYANIEHYSEWSTICLIKPLLKETLFDLNNLNIEDRNELNLSINTFIGNYTPSDEGEILSKYRIIVTDMEEKNIVMDSGFCRSNGNSFKYNTTYYFKEGVNYSIDCYLTTINGYTEQKTYEFIIANSGENTNPYIVFGKLDNDNGRILIYGRLKEDIEPTDIYHHKTTVMSHNKDEDFSEKEKFQESNKENSSNVVKELLVIKRSDNTTNFSYWEEVTKIDAETIKEDSKKIIFLDTSVEHGIWYKYSIAVVNPDGTYGPAYDEMKPIMPIFDSAFLVGEGKVLKIPYTTTVSSFKRNGLESKTETLGSKYPYIRKNAYVDYKSFSLSSIVSALADDNHTFVQDEDMRIYKYEQKRIDENTIGNDTAYQDDYTYASYNNKNNIMKKYDYIYEKAFRDEVMDFLYHNTVKLFKSPTEGNILIKLMSINFAPQEQLGRLIYTMNAEAVELATSNISNYHKYNILDSKTFIHTTLDNTITKVAQTQISIPPGSSIEIMDSVKDKYKNMTSQPETVLELKSFENMTFTFDGNPYPICITDNYKIISDEKDATHEYVMGYLIKIDDIPIIVNPITKFYQIPEGTSPNSRIEIFNGNNSEGSEPINVTVDYIISLEEVFNSETFAYNTSHKIVVGQLNNYFNEADSVVDLLKTKYKVDNYNSKERNYSSRERLSSINGFAIEAYPGTEIIIYDAYNDGKDTIEEETKFIMNETGYLRFTGEDISIKDIKIKNAFALIDYICDIEVKTRIQVIEGE